MLELKLDLKPIHVEPWLRFWHGFDEALDNGVRNLVGNLVSEGICQNDGAVNCSLLDTDSNCTAEEEVLARVKNSRLERAITSMLRVGTRSSTWELGVVPLLTQHGTFIRGGTDYALLGQLSHSYGVFLQHSREKKIPMATVILPNRRSFRLRLGKKGPTFSFEGRSPVAWSTMWEVLSPSLVEPPLRKVKSVAKAIGLVYTNEGDESSESHLLSAVRSSVEALDLGELGRRQLNRRLTDFGLQESPVSTMSVEMLSSIMTLLLAFAEEAANLAGKKADPIDDDPMDLGNLRIRLVDEFLKEALDDWLRTLHRRIRARWISADKQSLSIADALIEANLSSASTSCFTDSFRRWTVDMSICQRIPAVGANYVAAVTLSRRLTFNGPGGIRIGHDRVQRSFKWSHYGRLCPFDTPQSEEVGVTLSLAAGARINDLGQIEAPCFIVKEGQVTTEIAWISPWDEAGNLSWLIAFPDERGALINGQDLYAHRGTETLKRVKSDEITHIHVSEDAMLSIAASLVPYQEHNDAVRMNMACNFFRQSLPLVTALAPTVLTGAEQLLPTQLPFDAGLRDANNQLAFGVDLTVGYVIWKGWNFEDAIVISESAAQALTSLHFEHLAAIRLSRSLAGQAIAFSMVSGEFEAVDGFEPERFDHRGFAKEGTVLEPGKPYLLEPSVAWSKADKINLVPFAYENADERQGTATVHQVFACDDKDRRGWVSVVLRRERPAQVGDKLANRHGHKGVISRILPEHEMPYVLLDGASVPPCDCGETRRHLHLQVLINPLSVISRMNLGQLFETRDARGAELKKFPEKLTCHDPSVLDVEQRAMDDEVCVGTQYVMKLDHNAEDKWHARSTEAYSAFVQQPLGGRRHKGGQRLGEMEVWALQSHGVPHLLQEMLSLKSDNPWSRRILLTDIATGGSDAKPELPEALRTFSAFCYGLGLDLTLVGRDKHLLDPASDNLPPDEAAEIRIGLLQAEQFVKTVSKGVLTTPQISGRNELPSVRFHKDGLESEALFGPIKDFTCACGAHRFDASKWSCGRCGTPLLPRRMRRRRMAHIELAWPLPNPFMLFSTPVPFDKNEDGEFTIAFDAAGENRDTAAILTGLFDTVLKVRFRSENSRGEMEPEVVLNNAAKFIHLCARVSEKFREAVEARVGEKILEEIRPNTESAFGSQLASALAGVELAPPNTPLPTDISLGEATERNLNLNDIHADLSALAVAGRCAKLVNALLRISVDCPVDFVVKLLERSTAQESMLLSVIPVIPSDLRKPFKQGRVFKRNDLTVLYQAVLHATRDLKDGYPRNSDDCGRLRTAQFRAVARLMCNQRLPFSAQAWNPETRQLRKSLSSMLAGKEGLLVGNLLGKRVDFSARAVIVPDPNLPMDSCVLPLELAIKLYKPLILWQLNPERVLRDRHIKDELELLKPGEEHVAEELSKLRKSFKSELEQLSTKPKLNPVAVFERAERGEDEAVKAVSNCLEDLFKDYWIVLNRQPTLHRLGMLTFKPKLGPGSVISIPAMVTAGFNADFDGDQMAVYLPLTEEARAEAKTMLPSLHLWRPRDGRFALSLAQDIALGNWLQDKGTAATVAEAFESRPGDQNLIADIEESQKAAFMQSTKSGTSISIDDFELLGKDACEGDERDMARILENNSRSNALGRIVVSGARGNSKTLAYLAGTEYKERPGSNLTVGLAMGERFDQAQGGRKKVVDTKLGTAEGGALTKRFVGWSQHVQVTSENCKTKAGLNVTGDLVANSLQRWIQGRVLAIDIPALGLVVGSVIGRDAYEAIKIWLTDSTDHSIIVRSPEYCMDSGGVCRACVGVPSWHGLGWSVLDHEALAPIGTAIGMIAAQAAGEPGTQMALRSKHLAGTIVIGDDNIKTFQLLMDAAFGTFQSNSKNEGRNKAGDRVDWPTAYVHSLKKIDSFLVGQGIELSMIHLNTLIRGRKMDQLARWIANLSKPDQAFEPKLADFALNGLRDPLSDLRAQTVVGGKTVATRRDR